MNDQPNRADTSSHRETGDHTGSSTGHGLPTELGAPARRALTGAGYVRLEQLADVDEAELMKLHGVGPKAIDQIRQALTARGLTFGADSTRKG